MSDYSEKELKYIVDGFLNKTLPKSLWTHSAHIIAAIWHLMNFNKEDALCRLRSGIISYNLATGGENTGQDGYHETMTIFWWEIISRFLTQHSESTFTENCLEFLNSAMADKNFPFQFYSRERLLSVTARSMFIKPDLKENKNII